MEEQKRRIINLSLEEAVYRMVKELAQREHRTLRGQIIHMLEKAQEREAANES